jgi:hypothetical protein
MGDDSLIPISDELAKLAVLRSDETPAQLPVNVIADPLFFDIVF